MKYKLLPLVVLFCISFFTNAQQQDSLKIENYKKSGFVIWQDKSTLRVLPENYRALIDSLWSNERPAIAFPEIPMEFNKRKLNNNDEFKTAFEKTHWKRWLNEFKARVFDEEINSVIKNVATNSPHTCLRVSVYFDEDGRYISSFLSMEPSVFEILTLELSQTLLARSRNLGGMNGEPIPDDVMKSIYVWDMTREWADEFQQKMIDYCEAYRQDTTKPLFYGNLRDYLMPLNERPKAHYGKFSISITYKDGELVE